jgi:hypothetical protein
VQRILGMSLAVTLAAVAVAACSESSVSPASPELPEAPAAAVLPGDLMVANSNSAGAGSFRDAVEHANADPSIQTIAFDPSVSTIDLESGVLFTGTQDLTIHGNHATIDGAGAGGAAFTVTGGGDLTLIALTFRNAPGEGVRVEVPALATGTLTVSLSDVDILDNASHGVLVNDQVDPSTQEEVQPNADGSPASVAVIVTDSRFIGNGYSVSDRDGLRVNEGGGGDLSLTLSDTRAEDNGGDLVTVMNAIRTAGNGDAADGALKIREKEVGNLNATLTDIVSTGNIGSGIFVRESGDGSSVVSLEKVVSTANKSGALDPFSLGHGIELLETGGGNMTATVSKATVAANAGNGVFGDETGTGTGAVTLTDVNGAGNALGATGGGATFQP